MLFDLKPLIDSRYSKLLIWPSLLYRKREASSGEIIFQASQSVLGTGHWVNQVGGPSLLSQCLDLSPSSSSNSRVLLMHTLGGSGWKLKYLGPCHLPGRPGLNSGLLASSWPDLSCCRHLESASTKGRSLSLSFKYIEINKQKLI